MRIIGIVGVWSSEIFYRPMWSHLEASFKKRFPVSDFSVEYLWFSPWQVTKMNRFAEDIVAKYDIEGEEILLLGMSMGGVIATAIVPKFKKARVCQVVTIWSPHTFLGGIFSSVLDSNLEGIGVPTVSCTARYDCLVWWGTRYPAATKHIVIDCDHLWSVLLSSYPAEKIAEAALLKDQP